MRALVVFTLLLAGCVNSPVNFQVLNTRSNVQDGENLIEQAMEGGGSVAPETTVQ